MDLVAWIENGIILSLLPLAVWILVSGLDDLFLDFVAVWGWLSRHRIAPPLDEELTHKRRRRIAMMIPAWNEYRVIGQMLEHNLGAIHYDNYDVFVGCYPNDDFTAAAVREAEARFPNVHLALCPHPGPTSKADCLNWIYQRILLHEERCQVHYDIIVVHDSEDLIHPEEFRWINHYSDCYGMIQIPVLPLPTPPWRLTHGVYCDEFAEYQTKDVPARQKLRSFVPSNGVGTGYARWALDRLAQSASNCIFQPDSLTEDYENGIRLHQLGCPQLFVPLTRVAGAPVATREYFPQTFGSALRQRTRWVTGIALQAWEHHGWRGGWRQVYWFWRDRKGLVGNLVTVWANFVVLYGMATWAWSQYTGGPWSLAGLSGQTATRALFWATVTLAVERLAVRMACVARWYGWPSALFTPVRMFWANAVNSLATASAIARYTAARLRRQSMVWLKTDHMYPNRAALMQQRTLGEILVDARAISQAALAEANGGRPSDVRLGEHLLRLGAVSEEDLYRALSERHGVPFERLDPREAPLWVVRALPAAQARKWSLAPFRVSAGALYVAGPEIPTDEMRREIQRSTGLEMRFHFITPSNLRQVFEAVLGRGRAAT
jgi:adsorption protein B